MKEMGYRILLLAVNSIVILCLVLNSLYSDWVYLEEDGYLGFTGSLNEITSGFSKFDHLAYQQVSEVFCKMIKSIAKSQDGLSEVPSMVSAAGCNIFLGLYESQVSYLIMTGIAMLCLILGNFLAFTCIRGKKLFNVAPVFNGLGLIFMMTGLGIYFNENDISFLGHCQEFYTSDGYGSMCAGFGIYVALIAPIMLAFFLFYQIKITKFDKIIIEELKTLHEVK